VAARSNRERKEEALVGVVFSDLGRGADFVSLDWVRDLLRDRLGFAPFPGTLNLRLESPAALLTWRKIRERPGIAIPPMDPAFCHARAFRVKIRGSMSLDSSERAHVSIDGAVLVPEIKGYPADKIEVVAPVRIKQTLAARDGDRLTLEFLE
jgi:CTP-dependent riboflavin kinase